MNDLKRIPKIIHQIWLGPLEPPKEAMESWKDFHPNWEYILWTEKNLPALKNQNAFDRSDAYSQKADILRYEILQDFGGIFVDADEHCIKNIDPLFESIFQSHCDCFAVYEKGNSGLIANGIMGCTKNNPFMKKMVDEIIRLIILTAINLKKEEATNEVKTFGIIRPAENIKIIGITTFLINIL